MPAYKLQGRMIFQGLQVSIENRKGSVRKWYDPHGKEKGSTKMHYAYGYIRGSKGTDGDHVDVYIGPNPAATHAFIVNQMKKPEGDIKKDGKKWTKFDEQKVMLGFDKMEEAKAAYLKQYDDPRFFGSIRSMPMDKFKEKVLMKENHGKKVAAKQTPENKELFSMAARIGKKMKPGTSVDRVHTFKTMGNAPYHVQVHKYRDGTMGAFPGREAKVAQVPGATQPGPPGVAPPMMQKSINTPRPPPPMPPARAAAMMPSGGAPQGQLPKTAEGSCPGKPGGSFIRDRLREGKAKRAGVMSAMTPVMKRTKWQVPFKPPSMTQAAKRPFSPMAKTSVSDAWIKKMIQSSKASPQTMKAFSRRQEQRSMDLLRQIAKGKPSAGARAMKRGTASDAANREYVRRLTADPSRAPTKTSGLEVASLAVECGLEPYQAETALAVGSMLAKEAGIWGTIAGAGKKLVSGAKKVFKPEAAGAYRTAAKPVEEAAKPLITGKTLLGGTALVGTVGALGAGKTGIDAATHLATRPHTVAAPRRQLPGMPVIGRY